MTRSSPEKVGRAACLALALALLSCASGDRHPGEPCAVEGDCVPGSSCALVSRSGGTDLYECVARCDDVPLTSGLFGRCEGGELCYPLRSDHIDWLGCFPGGDTPIGAACGYPVECVRGAVCTLATETEGVCAPVCEVGGCARGEGCTSSVDCAPGLECAAVRATGTPADGECVESCTSPDAAADVPSLCPGGELCWRLYEGVGAPWGCYPGGDGLIGAPCEYAALCQRGAICGDRGAGAGLRCERACNDGSDCPSGACVLGICAP